MAVKIKVKSKENPSIEYPCLMISNDGETIVWFTGPRVGTCISNNSTASFSTPAGVHDSTWISSIFVPFTGSITLSNE